MNNDPIKFKAKCPNCGTEFKATNDDIAFDLDFCTHELIALCLICPNCGRPVYDAEFDKE